MLETHQLWETIDVRKRSFIDNVNPLRLFQYYCFDALTCNQYLCYTFCVTLLLFNSNMNLIQYLFSMTSYIHSILGQRYEEVTY